MFRPVGKDDCPVVFFVHGGGWMIGDKDDVFGIYGYGTIAESIARRGVVVVLPNYRLSPKAKRPDHIKDVARTSRGRTATSANTAVAPTRSSPAATPPAATSFPSWRPTRATSRPRACPAKDVKGVVSISGVYDVDAFDLNLSVKGEGVTIRAEVHPFASVFGDDPEVRKQASPLTHVRPGLPPFLLMYGSLDYCPIKRGTKDFEAALEDNDCDVDVKQGAVAHA